MNLFSRTSAATLVASLALAIFAYIPASASAAPMLRADCGSNRNLAHVHRRLDGAIDQLQHDQHDYGGHRERAIDDLQQARTQLIAAEQSAEYTARDNPRCFHTGGPTGGSDRNWGLRGERGSYGNLARVSAWVERMIDQLQRDNHDYGGHRVAAIGDMQAARNELTQARAYDRSTTH